MRLTIAVLGWTLDWTLEPTATEQPETSSLDGGTTASYETGGTEQPDFVGFVDRNNGWGDEGNRL